MSKIRPLQDRKVNKDAWKNVYTGLGTSKDKSIYSEIQPWCRMTREQCESLFATDEIAKKAAQIIPYDGTREGVTWNMGEEPASPEILDFIESEYRRLDIWGKMAWAWTQSRVYGGSLLYMATKGGGTSLERELNYDKVVSVENLHVLGRHEVTIETEDIESDINSPNYGKPNVYTYTPQYGVDSEQIKIHHSRVLRFDGVHLPDRLFSKNGYWHDSIYTSLYTAIKNYGITHDSLAVILQEFNQPVFGIEGLTEAIAGDESELVLRKVELVNIMRSVARAVVLDKEDTFANVGANTTGAKELVDLTVQRLVAGVDVPHTRLLGNSPTGLGGTGQSELINYYDNVGAQQKVYLRAPLETINTLLFNQTDAPTMPDNLSFVFNPLFQLDREKESRSRQIQADIDETYIKTGVLSPEEITQSRFGSGRYSYETVLDDSAGDRMSSEEKAFEMNAAAGESVAKNAANGSAGNGGKLTGGKRLKPGDTYDPEFAD